MSNACTPILMSMASLISEILLLSKMLKIFCDHGLYIYSSWSEREKAVFESSNISETNKAMPIKIGAHTFKLTPYLHNFFELILIDSIFSLPWTIYSPWSEGEIWPFLKVAISPKLK